MSSDGMQHLMESLSTRSCALGSLKTINPLCGLLLQKPTHPKRDKRSEKVIASSESWIHNTLQTNLQAWPSLRSSSGNAGEPYAISREKKGDFIGRDVLERQQADGLERRLVGFEMIDRGICRHGHEVFLAVDAQESVGCVTSGTHLPTLGKPMGMAYLPVEATDVGEEFFVGIRDRAARARVVDLPFYSSRKKKKNG